MTGVKHFMTCLKTSCLASTSSLSVNLNLKTVLTNDISLQHTTNYSRLILQHGFHQSPIRMMTPFFPIDP